MTDFHSHAVVMVLIVFEIVVHFVRFADFNVVYFCGQVHTQFLLFKKLIVLKCF